MAQRTTRGRADREARRRSRAYQVRQAVHADRGRRRRRDDVVAGIVFVVVVALATLTQIGFYTVGPGRPAAKPSSSSSSSTAAPTASPTPTSTRTLPPESLSQHRTWTGSLTLSEAPLKITLDGKRAPQAVANFVSLARSGFYDGTPCHRLTTAAAGIEVLQCGDPTGTGQGGPGYTFGPLENVPKSGTYPVGTLAMARSTAEDSQGSQFFIVYGSTKLPAPGYTVFGKVTGGLATLQKNVTSKGSDASNGPGDGKPKVAVSIRSVSVR